MEIDKCIGKNIRKYRIANEMTLKELSGRIHKSISTVCKYEAGTIALDMPTFAEISRVLHISPAMLLNSVDKHSEKENIYETSADIRYMYTYDNVSKCIILSVIERYPVVNQKDEYKINLFNVVRDTKNPGDCEGYYTGESAKKGFIETYILQNQRSQLERVLISCVDNLVNPNQQLGLICGLSNYTMLPVTFKTVISNTEISRNDELMRKLQFSKEDCKIIKQKQCLTILNSI